MPYDFELRDAGSIAQIAPLTDAAREWLDDNVEAEAWQYMGPVLCIDSRYAMAIVEGFVADGLTAEGTAEVFA